MGQHKLEYEINNKFDTNTGYQDLRFGFQTVLKDITYGRALRIGRFCTFTNVNFGNYWGCDDSCSAKDVNFGSFVSVGRNVTFNAGRHPSGYLSTHLVFFDPDFWGESREDRMHLPKEETYFQWREPMSIGSDVWIGSNTVIKTGVNIGHGAIIGANSVVIKDIPDYAIVAGVPAKLIRYRFDKKKIKRLLKSRWWELPTEKIRTMRITNVDEILIELGF